MKRFLSALTAFCMCASMTVSSLPASALTLSDATAINALAAEPTWTVGESSFTPGTDKYASIKIAVSGDPGTYGYEFTPLVDGKTLDQAGFTVAGVKQTDEGYNFSSFDFNKKTGHVGAASGEAGDKKLADKTAFVEIRVVPPTSAAAGTKYTVSLKDVTVGNEKEEHFGAKIENGSITIAGGSTTPSDPTPTNPTPSETTPVQTPTESMEQKKNSSEFTWYFDDVTYDPAKDKNGAAITAYVTKDPGTYGYEFTPLINGKTLKEAGFTIKRAKQTDEGYNFGSFDSNKDNGHLGGASSDPAGDAKLADGTAVVTLNLVPPADAKPGTVYEVSFKDLGVGNFKGEKSSPKSKNGTITVAGGSTVTPTNPTPTDPTPTEPVQQPTQSMDEKKDAKEWTWYFDDVTYDPEKDKNGAAITAYVTKDGGTYGYEFTPLIDGKSLKEAGFTIKRAKQTDEGYNFASFDSNKENGHLGGASSDPSGDMKLADGTAVVTLNLVPPADAKPGTRYSVTFKDLGVGNFAGTKSAPKSIAGTITVAGGTTTPTDPTPTTPAPTDPTPTTPAPTTPAPTDPVEPTNPTPTNPAPTDPAPTNPAPTNPAPTDPTPTKPAPTDPTPGPTNPTPVTPAPSEVSMEWIVDKVECNAGDTVKVPVKVSGNVGFNSYIAKFSVDSTALGVNAAEGGKLAGLDKVESNTKQMSFGSTDTSTGKNVTGDGDVMYLSFTVPRNAAAGTIYNIEFADLSVYNIDMVKLIPKTTAGWIKVKETKPSEPVKSDAKWVIGTTEVEPGAVVKLPISVEGDKDGLNSFIAKLTADKALTVGDAEQGDAYAKIKFEQNGKTMSYGGTYVDGKDVKPADGKGNVFYVTFTVPKDVKTSTKYEVNWSDLNILNGDMVKVEPATENGWIQVIVPTEPTPTETTPTPTETKPAPTDPTPTATVPTQPTPTETKPAPTDPAPSETKPTPTETTPTPTATTPAEPSSKKIDAEWKIGETVVEAGAEVDLPITVKGDKDGLNSYLAKLTSAKDAEGKSLTVEGASAGNAYAALKFEANTKTLAIGGTLVDAQNSAAASDDSVVFTVKFKVPADAKPGAKYDVMWTSLEIIDGDLVHLMPTYKNGWIKVKDEPTPTESQPAPTQPTPTESQPAPTQPTPTESQPAPTQPTPTESQPAPTQPTPTESQPAPTQPTPTESQPAPTQPTPTESQPAPTQPTPTESQPAPTQPTPTESQPAPTQPTDPGQVDPSNPYKDGRKSKAIWDISEEVLVAKNGAKQNVELTVSVSDADVAINGIHAELALDARAQADKVTSVAAEQGNAYSWIVLSPMNDAFVRGQLKFNGTADNNKNYLAKGNDVFYVTFEIPAAEDIDWTKAQTDADGRKYVLYGVDWKDLQLVNSGVDEKVAEYSVDALEKREGSIKVYEPEEADKIEYTYEYELNGKDMFCFSHDPRPFSSVFSNAKLIRIATDKETKKSTRTEISLRSVNNFKIETAEGGYTSPSAAYTAIGKDAAYKGMALKVSFEDGDNKVVLDASNGFKANAFIGVKGDANLDGVCNANDATEVLKYAAAVGTGVQAEKPLSGLTGGQLDLAMFLADATDEAEADQTLNANDATAILRYAANIGTVTAVNDRTMAEIWDKVLNPLPTYSAEIMGYLEKNASETK